MYGNISKSCPFSSHHFLKKYLVLTALFTMSWLEPYICLSQNPGKARKELSLCYPGNQEAPNRQGKQPSFKTTRKICQLHNLDQPFRRPPKHPAWKRQIQEYREKKKRWHVLVWFRLKAWEYQPLDFIGFRKGGPTLRTTLIKMYWKQETKNNAVFSEFSILLFSRSTRGGLNL